MKFSVPVIYTTVGWIQIEAKDLKAAKRKVKKLNDDGIEYLSIQDPEDNSELMINEIEVIDDA